MAIGRRTENQIIASFDCFFDPGGIVQSVQLDMIDTGGKLARSTIRRQDRRVIRRQNRPFRVNVRTDRILYQDFRDGLFELYIQSGRSYWSYCWCKCLFPVILTVISVLLNLAFMRVLSSGFQITAGADDAIGALIVSVLGTIVCSLGAMPMVYVSRNSDPTMAQLVLVLIAVLLQLAYMLVIVNVMPLCLFSVGYVVLVVVAIGISTGVFSRYFINTNIEL